LEGGLRGLLFDKDGTLIDFRASWSRAFRELCLELSGGDAKAAEAMLLAGGMDLETGDCGPGSVLGAGNTADLARLWYPALTEEAHLEMVERFDRAFFANGIRYSVLLPGVRETLDALAAAGYAMGVATSDGTAGTRAALAALKLDGLLPHVFGYDSVERPKPGPDMALAFADATGIPLGEIVVVGDNTHDLEMARSAGVGAAIGVLTGNSGTDELTPLADAVLASVCELPDWLETRQR
jgi:phosphoglycolate phosphatase